ncbi:MAG: TIGR02996 domain-containing protein [Gemmataceae bacterium]|nr:TIGR02996 domain-containing protein [Gemmataceae bacterium]
MPTDEQLALWAAIRDRPDDDLPRLVYADWLEEHGDPARAEFIRVQCRLGQLGSDRRKGRKERLPLEERERTLLAAHKEVWADPLCRALAGPGPAEGPAGWLGRMTFHRGFVRALYLDFRSAARLMSCPTDLEPVDAIDIRDCQANYQPAVVRRIVGWTRAECVTGLSVAGATDADVRVIVTAGWLTRLNSLGLWFGSVSDAGVVELARSPLVGRLRGLDLQQNAIGDRGALALVESSHLERVRYLELHDNRIGPGAAAELRERFGDALRM